MVTKSTTPCGGRDPTHNVPYVKAQHRNLVPADAKYDWVGKYASRSRKSEGFDDHEDDDCHHQNRRNLVDNPPMAGIFDVLVFGKTANGSGEIAMDRGERHDSGQHGMQPAA